MARSELLQETADALCDAEFEAYFNEGLRRYFDLIGIRDFRIFVKVLTNIDNLRAVEGSELRKFARAFSAQSFVVGERAGMEPLRDDILYHRFENPCVNAPTFRRILKGEPVSRFTKRGKFLVSIDGEALKELREHRGMSQEDLAKVLDCTGQTVYRIEKHNRIGEELLEKLAEHFGRNIEIGAVELREPAGKIELPVSDPLKKEIVKEYFRLKLSNTPFRTHIDFALEEKPVITPVSRTEGELRSKHRVAKNLADVLDCGIVHITREKKKRRLSAVSFEELHSLSSKKEILDKSS